LGYVNKHFIFAVGTFVGSGEMISGWLSGTLVNNATSNDVTIGYYLSSSSGLTNPESEGYWIATLTIPANSTVTIDDDSDFDSVRGELEIIGYLTGILGSNLYFYLTGSGDPTLDVTVQSLDMILPPNTQITEIITPGDLSDYTLEALQNSTITGTITNNGAAQADFDLFLSIGSVGGTPPLSDKIGHISIPPGGTVDLATTSFLLAGAQTKIETAIQQLFLGSNVEINLFGSSLLPLNLQVNNLSLQGDATVVLET